MEPAAAVTLIAVVLVILALVVYLVAVILELRKITAGLDAVIESVGGILRKTEPVNGVVDQINKDLSAGTDLLEGLLDKKAGQDDAAGLIESVYPGAGAAVLARQGRSGEVKNIDEVYTQGRRAAAAPRAGEPARSGRDVRRSPQGPEPPRARRRGRSTRIPSGPVADEPGRRAAPAQVAGDRHGVRRWRVASEDPTAADG